MESNYYQTKESVNEYIEMAKSVSSKQLIEKFVLHLDKEAKVLEIGSGPGTDWEILNQSHHTIGSDFSEEFFIHLNRKYPKGDFLLLDALTLATDKKFDAIYSNKVLQHLTDDEIKESINRQLDILTPGGIICHSVWKGEGSEEFKGMYVNYQTTESLRALFEHQFEILLLEEYQEFDPDDSIVIIGEKL